MDSGSGGCDESYSTDTGVGGSACDMEISPGMTKYWRPICANSLKPHVGQQFDSLGSAFGFYKQYAGSVGFDCRQSTTRKGRDGGIVLKHVWLYLITWGWNFSSDLLRSFSCLSITIFSGYSIDVIPTMGLLFLRHLGYPSMRPPLERMSEGAISTRVDILSSAVAMVLVVLVISSTKSFWGSVPAALVGVGHQHGESMDLLLQGVIHAVVFSKIALHSRRISGTALAARFVISICPIGSPRVAATSAAVIWIDCPFWSCKVQLLGSKFSTNHNPNLRGEPDDNTEQPDTRSPEAITNPQPTSEEESESDNDQDQFLMASQNPFTTFFTYEDRLTLARKIVQGISDFNPAACAKIALTFALNPSLMDDLTMKDSRRIMELAKLCSEVPWNLPESAVLDPEQSAPPTQTLAELRTTNAVPAATAVAAQSAPAPTDVADQSATAPADVAAQSATAPADVAGQSATAPADVATRSATTPPDVAVQPLPQATPAATMPPVSANLPQVRDVAATQPGVHGVHSTAASSDPLFIAPPGSSVSHVDATTIPSTKIGVSSVFFSDKKVLSSGSLNYQSASDLASSEKLVFDVIKSHDVSLVSKLPTTDLSLDSIRVSIPEIQSVPLVYVLFSATDQCNPVASRTRTSKAKLANRVIPAVPSVKRKLIMDSVSDVEPPRKSQKSVSTRQLRGQVSISHSLQKPSGFPLPILLNKSVQAAWSINRDRSLLLQRNIDVENFTACCNLIDLLRSQNLLQTVTNVGPYCDLVTREFYTNLTEATVDRDSDHFHNVFLRRHWYDFSPAVINDFFDRTEVDVQFSPDYDLIASSLSNSHYRTWPKRDTKKPGFRKHPQEEELSPTSVYSIDRRLFFKSHFDDCSTFKSAVVPEGESVSSTRSRVSVDFAAVSARVLTTQSIIKSLKSTVVQMEKVLLEDQMLLQSFETDEMDLDSAR
nr:protein FAR1-RELATED SEQUENCE 5-like [Ipomoea batatas]